MIESPDPHAAASSERHAGERRPTRAAAHPFTAPAVRPRTSWRWKTSSTSDDRQGGDDGAGHRRGWAGRCPARSRRAACSPLCTVFMSLLGGDQVRPQVLVPRRRGTPNSAERAERRAHERQRRPPAGSRGGRGRRSAPASRSSFGIVRNTWRSRNVPNAVARNGTASPWYVFSQPSESIVRRLTTSVASSGTSSVARNSANRTSRPREVEERERVRRQHRRRDLAPTVTMTATTIELNR